MLLFLNICKQTFHISHVCISQKVKGYFNVKSSTYYFHMERKKLGDFQICISVPLHKCFQFQDMIWKTENPVQAKILK